MYPSTRLAHRTLASSRRALPSRLRRGSNRSLEKPGKGVQVQRETKPRFHRSTDWRDRLNVRFVFSVWFQGKISALFRCDSTGGCGAAPMGRRRTTRRRAWTTVARVAMMTAARVAMTRAFAMPGFSVSVRGVRAVPKCFPDCVDARLDVVEAREARHDPGWTSNRDVILMEALAEEATEAVRDFADWTGLIEETLGNEGVEGVTDPREFWARLERAMNRIELN